MVSSRPSALILGHSFVWRLRHDLENGFDFGADAFFNLQGSASVYLFGISGRTASPQSPRCFHSNSRHRYFGNWYERPYKQQTQSSAFHDREYSSNSHRAIFGLDPSGQYQLYRSYRSAILKALGML